MLLTLVGSACSGKTTALRALGPIDGFVLHDFDTVGVSSGADTRWRQRVLEQWVQRTVAYEQRGVSVVLASPSPLGEVLACPSATDLDGIAVCLLDVDDEERLARLEHRDPGRWDERIRAAFVGWGRWHREHAADPRARPEVITRLGWEEMRWDRWATWDADDPRWATTVIDTTGGPVEDTVNHVVRWIPTTRSTHGTGRSPLARGWG